MALRALLLLNKRKKLILYGHVLRQARNFLSLVNFFSAAFRVTYKVVASRKFASIHAGI